VDDRVRLRDCDGCEDGGPVEAVEHDRLGAERAQRVRLRGAARGAGDSVPVAGEEGDQRATDRAARPRDEDVHVRSTRQRDRLCPVTLRFPSLFAPCFRG
jgi:hypothetical protein